MEKQYNHLICEKKIQTLWDDEQVYTSASTSKAPVYTIDTPPPTVSGSLHIGHIFSYTHTDIIARYKRMSGFNVFYPFGFDDNGLATERFVEKKRKIRAHQLSRSEFINQCLEETKIAQEAFVSLWQRMGISANWSHTYSTISANVRHISQASFVALYKKGHIYRRQEPAIYCTVCRTSVAQAELDDLERQSLFNDIAFLDETGNPLIIATTRPELLPSCVALFFNPTDERYKKLKGTLATVPIFNYQVPILADELVNPEKGTGLVMCCTFGDTTDIEWYKKHKLAYRQSIGNDGIWLSTTGLLAGLKGPEARAAILQELALKNLLVAQKEITQTINVHERCKNPIEFAMLHQWFIEIVKHKKTFLELANTIAWHPAFMKTRYIDWVEHIDWDWCISRQRFYGIPFPVWHCNNCSAILLAESPNLPVDPQETAYPKKTCTECNSDNIAPDTDVMDTWNTSSLTPYICASLASKQLSPEQILSETTFTPMSMRPQAHDIIRTWAFYTIIKTWMHQNSIPWKEIVISGHVLSDQKEKLSKSKENSAMAPESLLQRYPADAIRYWTASGNLGHDITFSETQIKVGQRLITKLWNAFRFTNEHIATVDPILTPAALGSVNEWILHQSSECFVSYKKNLNNYEFGIALTSVEHFFWNDFCDNYLELIKNQLFNPAHYKQEELEATRWTLYHVGLRIIQLYAPYLPYVTETIYQEIYRTKEDECSLHIGSFIKKQPSYIFDTSAKNIEVILSIVAAIRKLKTEAHLSLKTPLLSLKINAQSALCDAIKKEEKLIKGVTQAAAIEYTQDDSTNQLIALEDQWIAVVKY